MPVQINGAVDYSDLIGAQVSGRIEYAAYSAMTSANYLIRLSKADSQ